MKQVKHDRAMIEGLECRTFLSVGAEVAGIDPADVVPVVMFATPAPQGVPTPNLVGRYSGKIRVTVQGFSNAFSSKLVIKSQNSGIIKGTISIAGVGSTAFSMRGTIANNGTFTARFSESEASGSLAGKVQSDGSIKGGFTGRIGFLVGVGSFNYAKIA